MAKQGIGLAGTAWLKPLKDGLYEFRVRSTAAEIVRMYADAGHVPPEDTETILLRVFVAFHGNRVVLLLDGYDKAADPSPTGANTLVTSRNPGDLDAFSEALVSAFAKA